MTSEPRANEPEPFHIVVFGQSNTNGVMLADPSQAWPYLVARELESRLGRPVRVTTRPIYAHVSGAVAYLERELSRWQPDLVLLGATPYAFAQKTVAESLRRRIGGRAGRWYQRLEEAFDRRTRHSRLGSRLNRGGRRVAKALLGAQPPSTYDAVIAGYTGLVRRVVQEEAVALTVFSLSHFNFSRDDPAVAPLLRRFDEDIAAITGQAHAAEFNGGGLSFAGPELLLPDGVHFNARGHEAVAAEFLRAIEAGEISLDR